MKQKPFWSLAWNTAAAVDSKCHLQTEKTVGSKQVRLSTDEIEKSIADDNTKEMKETCSKLRTQVKDLQDKNDSKQRSIDLLRTAMKRKNNELKKLAAKIDQILSSRDKIYKVNLRQEAYIKLLQEEKISIETRADNTANRLKCEMSQVKVEVSRLQKITSEDAAFLEVNTGSHGISISRGEIQEKVNTFNMDLRSFLYMLSDHIDMMIENGDNNIAEVDVEALMSEINKELIARICLPFCHLSADVASSSVSCEAFRRALSLISDKYHNLARLGNRCEAWVHWALIRDGRESGKEALLLQGFSKRLCSMIGAEIAPACQQEYHEILMKLCEIQCILRQAMYEGQWSLVVDRHSGEVELKVN